MSCQRLPRPRSRIVSLEVDQAALPEPAGSQELALSTGLPGQIPGVSQIYDMLES